MQVCSVTSNSLWTHGWWSGRVLCQWNFPGKNTGMGCHFFQTQGLNPGLWCPLHWQADSLPLRHLGSPEKDSRISKQDISKAIIDSWFQPQNVNFWKLSLYSLTITNNLGKLKFSYFPWAHRELRFQGKPPPWTLERKESDSWDPPIGAEAA